MAMVEDDDDEITNPAYNFLPGNIWRDDD
jgi:hypothetical protein